MHLTAEQLAPIQDLYDRGLFLRAWHAVSTHNLPPLRAWRGGAARVLGGRLAGRLGAPRLASAMFARAQREAPAEPRVALYHLYAVLARSGPWAAWLRLPAVRAQHLTGVVSSDGAGHAADPESAADLACLRAVVLAALRDFAGAHAALAEASELGGDLPWVAVQRAEVLAREDRCDEALAVSEQVRRARPAYVPAAQQSAHLLQQLGRDHEALRVLQETDALAESCDVAAAISLLQEELGDFDAALAAVERTLALAPLAEEALRTWASARSCDLELRRGRRDAAATHAAAAGGPFYGPLAARLADATADAERVALEVPFVRQHHMTCGPATLVALAQTLGRAPDHLQVADEICYGGTTAANARRWALRNGFVAREFTLSRDDARTLLRLGLPFAVATSEVTSGHLQAVLGFDAVRDTWLVRDPSTRRTREWMTREFLEHYRASGPRALVLLPAGHPGAHLPPLRDEALYDDDFVIQEALVAHDYARALAVYHGMLEREPEHPLTIQARWALSAYERDPVGVLACLERLLALYPDDPRLRLRKLWCLTELDHTEEVVAMLEAITAARGCDPTFLVMRAEELRRRVGGAVPARRLLRRALLQQPTAARAHFTLGLLAWQSDDAADAGASLRFAACLDETNDDYALAYSEWCRTHAVSEQGLAFLRARQARWLRLAGGPSVALYRALRRVHRLDEARAVLQQARQARPDDGELLLAEAEEALRRGDLAAAEAALRDAEGRTFESQRLAALADVAERAGDRARAVRCWRSILAREPLHQRARAALFELLELEDGRAAALADLEAAADELPFARPLRRYHAHQLGRDDPVAAAAALRRILDEDPSDAWAHRELALQLAAQGELAAALESAEAARDLDTDAASSHAILGRILTRLDRSTEAEASLRRALARDVDEVAALVDWWELAADAPARRALCEHLVALFSTRAGDGRGLAYFARAAAGSLPEADVRAWLTAIATAQPHARAASSALVTHLLHADDVETAHAVAERACVTFPLDPRAWLDRAAVAHRRGDDPEECAALERASVLAPDSTEVTWHLASAHLRHDRRDEARAVLDHAGAFGRDANIEVLLAELSVADGAPDAALGHVRRALRLDPDHHAAWQTLQRLAELLADRELPVREARALLGARPHDPAVCLTLASMLMSAEQRDERRAAIQRALALDPSNPDAYDLLAELEAERGEFAAARRALAAWPGALPCNLRGRRAWLTRREGHLDAAIAEMRQVLAENPFYTFGWRELLEWLHDAGRDDELAAAADAYARSRPSDYVALGWVAEASLRRGDRAAAKVALRRALRLDPEYTFAAQRLFQLELDDGELEQAGAHLDLLARSEQSARVELFGVQLACRLGDSERAGALARALCERHGDDDEALWAAADALQAAGYATAAHAAVADLMHTDAGRGAGVLAMRLLTAAGAWRAARACVGDASLTDAAFVGAASTLLDAIGSSARPARIHALLRGRVRARLRRDDATWSKVGYCLSAAGRPRQVVRWMADWRERPGRQAWMLVNLVYALRCLGRHDAAHAVGRDAVERPSWPAVAAFHHLWLGYDAFRCDDLDAARQHLAGIDGELDEATQPLRTLLDELLAAVAEPRARARSRTRRALQTTLRGAVRQRNRALASAVRSVATTTRRRHGVPSRLWVWLVS